MQVLLVVGVVRMLRDRTRVAEGSRDVVVACMSWICGCIIFEVVRRATLASWWYHEWLLLLCVAEEGLVRDINALPGLLLRHLIKDRVVE